MSAALLAGVLGASLAGSLHCVGMCGGFVALTAGASEPGARRAWWPMLSYHLGRLFAYAALGAAAGAVGSAVDVVGNTAGLMDAAAILAGATILAVGVAALARALGVRLPAGPRFAGLSRLLARINARWKDRPPVVRALVLGLLMGLLPCGWLWAFLVTAAGTASAGGGALVMASFWVGTVPILLGLGLGVRVMLAPLRRRLPYVVPVLLIGVGMAMLVWRSQLTPPLPKAPASASAPTSGAPCHGPH